MINSSVQQYAPTFDVYAGLHYFSVKDGNFCPAHGVISVTEPRMKRDSNNEKQAFNFYHQLNFQLVAPTQMPYAIAAPLGACK